MEKSRARKRRQTPSAEKKDEPRDSDKPMGSDSYRCPACGALVNGRDRAEMRLHHQHMLFPNRSGLRQGAPKQQGDPNGPN